MDNSLVELKRNRTLKTSIAASFVQRDSEEGQLQETT